METIVVIKVGSHLYGTATSSSDLDIKGILMPQARDILLQKIPSVFVRQPTKGFGQKNTAGDVDYELYSPMKYLGMLAHGQTIALEMLFAPESAMLCSPHPVWYEIKALAQQILTKRAASFVHYCQQQAQKYSIKGVKVVAARRALEVFKELESRYGKTAKLACGLERLQELAQETEFIKLDSIDLRDGAKELAIEVCGKKALLNASIKSAVTLAQHVLDEYGQRALAAEQNCGVDWKALSHAVRIGHEALEFFRYQTITFPRPEAAHLLAIKQGFVPYDQVIQEIELLVEAIQKAEAVSLLPETYEQQVVDDFIIKLHRQQVINEASV